MFNLPEMREYYTAKREVQAHQIYQTPQYSIELHA